MIVQCQFEGEKPLPPITWEEFCELNKDGYTKEGFDFIKSELKIKGYFKDGGAAAGFTVNKIK